MCEHPDGDDSETEADVTRIKQINQSCAPVGSLEKKGPAVSMVRLVLMIRFSFAPECLLEGAMNPRLFRSVYQDQFLNLS